MRLPRRYKNESPVLKSGDYIVGVWEPGKPFVGWMLPKGWHWLRYILRWLP